MTCEQTLESLSEYLDGSLAAEKRLAIEEHLTTCDNCHQEAYFLKTLFETAPLASSPVPEGMRTRIMDKIQKFQESIPTEEALVPAPIVLHKKTFDFAKFLGNRKLMGGLVAACLLVMVIPLWSAMQSKDSGISPRMASDNSGGLSQPPSNAPAEGAVPNAAPSAFSVAPALEENATVDQNVILGDPESNALNTTDAPAPAPTLGSSAAAELTEREVIVNFGETSVRYFNELTANENFDLSAFISVLGPENIQETNLRYYLLLSDEMYSQLLNQIQNKKQIVPLDSTAIKLDPLAKKGIIFVRK